MAGAYVLLIKEKANVNSIAALVGGRLSTT